jgi:hypothetical protein
MALSGTLNSTDYSGRYIQFSWDATQDVAKNQTTIKWTLKGAGKASSSWYNSGPFYVAIGGEKVYESSTRIKLYEGTLVTQGTKVITHNNAGAASFAVSIKAAIYSASYNCSGSKTFTLNTIPRKATITSAPNFDDEDNPTIKYSNPAGNSVTSLKACISLDGSAADIAYRDISKTGTSYTFTLTDAERKVLRAATTTANSRTVKFFIETVISGTTYRHSVSKTLSIVNAAPTISPTVVDIKPETLALTGNKNIFIRYHSNASFSFGSSTKKEATVKSRSLTSGTKSSKSGTGTFYGVDSGTFKFTLTDSRGNSASATLTKNIIPYVDLTCALTPKAALAEDNTTTITLAMSGNYFNGSFGAVDNTLVVQYRHKVSGGDYGPWINAGIVSTNNNKYVAKATISSLDYTQEYVVQARAIDKIATNGVATKEIVVRTKPVFDWGKEDFAFHTSVYLDNAKQLYGKTTEGQDLMMISLNASNQSFFGYGGYSSNIGSTYFDGNAVNIRSKSNIACTASGTIGGNKSWTNSSDERLKTAIEDIPEVFAQIWMELTPKMFEWNELNHTDGKKQFGLIAQEAITIFNKYGVDYTEFDFISIIPVNEVDYFAITYDHYHMLTAQVLKNTVNELHSLKQEINEIKAMI